MASKRSPKNTVSAQRELEALRLRALGHSFDEIGAALGITRQGATKAYDRGMAGLKEETKKAAEHALEMELFRCDLLQKGLMPAATAGETHAALAALRVMDRRAKYLGLDAPSKSEITGKDGEALGVFAMPMRALTPEEWAAEAKALAAAEEDAAEALVSGLPDGSA